MKKTKKLTKYMLFSAFVVLLVIIILFVLNPPIHPEDRACFPDKYCISLEIRDSPEERAVGLMFRQSIDEDKGMLFIFDKPDRYSFWMKNMNFPIDIIFLDTDKKIIDIFQDTPACTIEPCAVYTPASQAQYVIETMANFSQRHILSLGQKVEFNI
jgi:uncharacterized membrane protein (UPF0127 family)